MSETPTPLAAMPATPATPAMPAHGSTATDSSAGVSPERIALVARTSSSSPPPTGQVQFAPLLVCAEQKGFLVPKEDTEEEAKWSEEHEPKPAVQTDATAAPDVSSSPTAGSAGAAEQPAKPNLPGTISSPSLRVEGLQGRIKRRSGALPTGTAEALRAGGSGDVSAQAAQLSAEELEALEESHTITYERTLTCNAPRALLWRHLMNKIRHPQCYTHARAVKILCEGPDFVFRDITVGPPGCAPEDLVAVREKVTWSEEEEEVRFSLYEDQIKEGYVENSITLDASGQVCLTVSCRWTFNPHAGMTPELLNMWRTKLKNNMDAGCVKTVRVVEDEAKQLLQEQRRRRHSVSLAELAHQNQQNKDKEHKQPATAAEHSASGLQHIQVAPKPVASPASAAAASSSVAAPADATAAAGAEHKE